MSTSSPRLGAHLEPEGAAHFAVFADAQRCTVQLVDAEHRLLAEHELEPQGAGYFHAVVKGVERGALYFFSVDGRRLPDPYARYLPQGVHGPAEVRAAL